MDTLTTLEPQVHPARDTKTDRFVFIRGTGRCGSKMLVNQLGRHPGLHQVPLNEILPEELLDWTEHRVKGYWDDVPDEAADQACRAYFSAFCRSLTTSAGIFVQKSTMRAHRLDDLLRCWPQSRMIYLVRHPLGVVESLVNSDLHRSYKDKEFRVTVANSLLRWYNDIQAYLRSRAFGHPRVLQIQFEQLVGRPKEVLERIYRFIGVEPLPYAERSGADRYDRRFVLNESERRWVLESTQEVVTRLGYDPRAWSPEVPAEHAHLIDAHTDRRLGPKPPALDGVELIRLALAQAVKRGYQRIGLFGAGYLAHIVCPHLHDMPAEIACIFDEDPLLVGRQLAGLPIHRPEKAVELDVQAVVPFTWVHQAALMRRWKQSLGLEIPIVPLWEEGGTP